MPTVYHNEEFLFKNKYCLEFIHFGKVEGALVKMWRF